MKLFRLRQSLVLCASERSFVVGLSLVQYLGKRVAQVLGLIRKYLKSNGGGEDKI